MIERKQQAAVVLLLPFASVPQKNLSIEKISHYNGSRHTRQSEF